MSTWRTAIATMMLIPCSGLPAPVQDGRRAAAQIFQRLDRNRDGYVDDTELQRQSVFAQYDADGDGRISRAELGLPAAEAAAALRVVKDVARPTADRRKRGEPPSQPQHPRAGIHSRNPQLGSTTSIHTQSRASRHRGGRRTQGDEAPCNSEEPHVNRALQAGYAAGSDESPGTERI